MKEVSTDIFTPDNTRWECENGERNLVFTWDIEEFCSDNNITEDKFYELLGEYQDECLDVAEYEEQVRNDYARMTGGLYV